MNILVVDDEPSVRQLLRRLLDRDFSATVLEADDGLTALDRLLKDPVDLVLLDLSMPTMGGIETLEAIRRSESYAQLPVVLMTAVADERHVLRAMELGVAGFIVKPFTPDVLRERLTAILREREQAGDQAPARSPRFLEIDASHRALIVDQSREFRAIARRQIGRLCDVDEAENEFVAMKRCLRGSIDLLVIGSTSELSTPEALARKIRVMPELGRVRLAAAVAPDDADRMKALGLFDAVVARSFVEDTFDQSLYHVLGQRALARLLFHPTSPCIAELVASTERGLAEYLGNCVTLQDAPPPASSDSRWTSVAVEIQGGHQAWELRMRFPVPLMIAASDSGDQMTSDRLSEEQVVASAGRVVATIVEGFCPELHVRGLTARSLPPRLTAGNGAGATGNVRNASIRRWAITPQRQAIPIELVSIATSDATTVSHNASVRAHQLAVRS